MTLEEQRVWVDDPEWQAKVRQLAVKASVAVSAESAGAAHHAIRAALAVKVLNEPDLWAKPFTAAVATNVALSTTPSDGDLEFTLNSLYDAMAGAPGPA
jgi:hypothetical protein